MINILELSIHFSVGAYFMFSIFTTFVAGFSGFSTKGTNRGEKLIIIHGTVIMLICAIIMCTYVGSRLVSEFSG